MKTSVSFTAMVNQEHLITGIDMVKQLQLHFQIIILNFFILKQKRNQIS